MTSHAAPIVSLRLPGQPSPLLVTSARPLAVVACEALVEAQRLVAGAPVGMGAPLVSEARGAGEAGNATASLACVLSPL